MKKIEKTMATIKAYQISVRETQLDDLHERIKKTRWPAAIPGKLWQTKTCQYKGSDAQNTQFAF